MKVLIAIDSSEASEAVIQEMIARRWPAGSSALVVNTIDFTYAYSLTPEVMDALQEGAKILVSRAAGKLKAAGIDAQAIVLAGNPRAAIVEQAVEWKADHIVLGAHGTGALQRLLLGSVSLGVLRHAPCSVEIVRPGAHTGKVLVAVDGSLCSQRVAEVAAGIRWREGTQVRVLTAVELHLGFLRAAFEIPALDPSNLEKEKEEAMRRAQDAVRQAVEVLSAAGIQASESISVLQEPPKQTILREAAEWGADLIVVGSHGRGAMDRLLIGSTSEGVATHAACSVLVVR